MAVTDVFQFGGKYIVGSRLQPDVAPFATNGSDRGLGMFIEIYPNNHIWGLAVCAIYCIISIINNRENGYVYPYTAGKSAWFLIVNGINEHGRHLHQSAFNRR